MNRPKKRTPSKAHIFKPLSPFQRRMLQLSARLRVPLPGSLDAIHLQKTMDMDVGFQIKWKGLIKRLPHVIHSRMKDGSGLQVSSLLRSYFLEYSNRYCNHGPEFFPTSFNVVESFMQFDHENMLFDLKKEVEHLLSADDYFRWYESEDMPKEGTLLESILPEGVIYSYDMVSNQNGYRIVGNSQQVIAAVSIVRHEHELSCLLLAGENPPLISDAEAVGAKTDTIGTGREGIVADPSLTAKDRYLDVYPDFSKIVMLTRFDLQSNKYDVRYLNLDLGKSFAVLTDDTLVMRDMSLEFRENYQAYTLESLKRYNDLFSALSSLIYLPVFFTVYAKESHVKNVATELHTNQSDVKIRDVIRELGKDKCVFGRDICCMPKIFEDQSDETNSIVPPPLEFQCDGYWKGIGPQEMGEGKNGESILGRTWVSRYESWSAQSPQAFMLRRIIEEPEGPDPGTIYVQRSGAHEKNLYKVGLTRRLTKQRSAELSSATGVPLPFDVLATWSVGDCKSVEEEVHAKLAKFRVNPRREFFLTELSSICDVINTAVKLRSSS